MSRTHTTLAAHLLTFLAVFPVAPAQADEPAQPASRAEAIAIIAHARKIVTPNEVERLEKVRIGGIDQWVSIRGTDRRNPVLLHIHGGPHLAHGPTPWLEMIALADAGFTVLYGNPRGSVSYGEDFARAIGGAGRCVMPSPRGPAPVGAGPA